MHQNVLKNCVELEILDLARIQIQVTEAVLDAAVEVGYRLGMEVSAAGESDEGLVTNRLPAQVESDLPSRRAIEIDGNPAMHRPGAESLAERVVENVVTE